MIHLQKDTSVPLHAQIAQELRYRIGTGNLERGSRLPAVRDAAERWGVHYHTVRRAYADLEGQGLAVRRGPLGTFVADQLPTDSGHPGLATFVERTIDEAHRRFGLSWEQLSSLLGNRDTPPARRVTVVECNRSQAAELAADLRRTYAVKTTTRLLSNRRSLPDGIIVSTMFHRGEVLERWPERAGATRFLRIVVNPIILEQLRALGPLPHELPLFESDAGQGRSMAADVQAIVPDSRCRIRYRPLRKGGLIPSPALRSGTVLVTPRHWNRLPASQRNRSGVLRVPYHFDRADLDSLAPMLGRSSALDPETLRTADCPWAEVS